MMHRLWARHGWAIGVGAALTCAAACLHAAGLTERLELYSYDFLVRHFSNVPPSDRLLHVDIDDDALDRVGSWPWPRDLQADLVRVLNELGARQVVMDIVFSEPKPFRLPEPDRSMEADGDADVPVEWAAQHVIHADRELAEAIDAGGDVYLAMYYEQRALPEAMTDLERRITEALHDDFELDGDRLAERLGVDAGRVKAVLAGIKRRVARQRVSKLLAADPDATFREVHAAMLSTPFDRLTADRADVLSAYQFVRNVNALRGRLPDVPEHLHGLVPKVNRIVPPLRSLTRAAHGLGFVTFEPDLDGLTRRVPLLSAWDGKLVEQLGFAAVRDALDISLDDVSVDQGGMVIAGAADRPPLRVPLDERGRMLINWHVAEGGWNVCFDHLPVAALLQITDARRNRQANVRRREWALDEAVRTVSTSAGFEAYRSDAEQGRMDDVQRRRDDAIELITMEWEALRDEPVPTDEADRKEYERFRKAYDLVHSYIPELEAANAMIASQCAEWIDALRPRVAGRMCFIGYTATAVADMITTSAYERMPGVLVHSQVANDFLQGRFRRQTSLALQIATIAVLGAAMTLLTVIRGPMFSAWMMLLLIGSAFSLNAWLVFGRMDVWHPMTTALALTFTVWAAVVLVRLLVTDRQRRRFVKAVAQYVSPAMARRMADSDAEHDLAPREAEVTCFFSDLKGFTRISERLGPSGTRTVLNPYLEAMSAALHDHDALINKFMGDGIFAFFNAPILPCPAHPVAACEAAVACRDALDELKRRHQDQPLAAEYGQLAMRIGIAGGPVFVGDYGSATKLDYTCVGDVVNLAARLESANKQFGTGIMVSEATRAIVGQRFAFRYLGRILVVGQTVPVGVHELIGRIGEITEADSRFSELWDAAVAAYTHAQWRGAVEAFERCLALRPDDPGCVRYVEASRSYISSPPSTAWSGALELLEK